MYKSRSVWIGLGVVACAVAAVVLVSLSPRAAVAGGGDPQARHHGIVPLGERVNERSYGEWTAAWWQWISSFDPSVNPNFDTTGQYAGMGQFGPTVAEQSLPVWFLAGSFGGTYVLNFTIPRDKYLLMAIDNAEWDTSPGIPNILNLPDPLSIADLRAITAAMVANPTMTCTIDGEAVPHLELYRVRSPVFSMNLDPAFMAFAGYPEAYVRTCVSDGYWLMLYPLDPGQHVIHFTVPGFLDITDNITVSTTP